MNNSQQTFMQNSLCPSCGQELRLSRPGIILTGGTCVGKSTVLNELRERGYTVIQEAAKAVIRENELKPGCNRGPLQEQIFARQLEWESKFYSCACNPESGPVFADRCLIDSMTYADHFGTPVSQELRESLPALAKLRYDKAFLFENLGFFEATDGRVESPEQGLAFSLLMSEKLRDNYRHYQIPTVAVRAMPVAERVQFILEECGLALSGKQKHWEYIQRLTHF